MESALTPPARRPTRLFRLSAALVILVACPALAPWPAWANVQARWRQQGPFVGGLIAMAAPVNDPNVAYALVAGAPPRSAAPETTTHLYRTSDGGARWHRIRAGDVVMALDPQDGDRVDAVARGYDPRSGFWVKLSESVDGGATWRRRPVPPPAPTRAALAIDPTTPQVLYWGSAAGLWRSAAPNAPWTKRLAKVSVTQVVVDVQDHRNVYVAGQREGRLGVWRSMDAGDTWTRLGVGATALAIDPGDARVLYAAGSDGVFRSIDRGDQWTSVLDQPASRILSDPSLTGRVYVPGLVSLRSDDRGDHWQELPPLDPTSVAEPVALAADGTVFAERFQDGWVTDILESIDGGDTWTSEPKWLPGMGFETLAVDPNDPGVVYLARYGTLWASTDGGETWTFEHIPWEPMGGGDEIRMALEPGVPSTLYIDQGSHIDRTVDRGDSWTEIRHPTDDEEDSSIAAAPSDPQRLYLNEVFYQGPGGIYVGVTFRSEDGGATWTHSSGPGGPLFVDPVDANHVFSVPSPYLGPNHPRLMESTNGGTIWVASDHGLPSRVQSMVIDPSDPSRLFATACGGPHGVFRSTDGAATWHPVLGSPAACGALAMSPTDPSQMALDGGRDVFVTTNGGANWTQACRRLPAEADRAWQLAFDADGTQLRAATNSGEYLCNLPG